MGLDPFNFADALLGVLAQRLARRICAACKTQVPMTRPEYDLLAGRFGVPAWTARVGAYSANLSLWSAPGCAKCGDTGYKRRVAIHELMLVDEELKPLIQHRKPVAELRAAAAAKGMRSLVQDGIEKVLSGLTDLAQVMAVCAK